MSGETELERMVIRLIGDGSSYKKMLEEAAKQTSQFVKNVGDKLMTFGKMTSLAITAPLTALSAAANQEFTEFQAALARMEGLVGVSADEVEYFKQQILSLSGSVAKSPVELAKAMEFITGSGIQGAEALETLTAAAKAGTAGLGETVQVANAVTSAMNAYGPSVLSATKATDILVASVREGKAEASEFAPVFGQVLPLAAEMGVSFSEVGGALAFLTRTTGNASIATTQLRSMMTQLMRADMDKKLKKIGLSSKYVTDSIRQNGLVNALIELKAKAGAAGVDIKTLITDTEGLMGALQFTGPQSQIAVDMIQRVGEAAGDTEKAFQAAAKTTKFTYAKAMAEMKVILIEIGEVVAPVFGQLINWTQLAIGYWKSLNDETKQTAVYIGGILAAVGPATITLGQSFRLLGSSIGAFGPVLSGIATLGSAVFSPWGVAIAAVAGGIYALIQKAGGFAAVWDMVSASVQDMWTKSSDIFNQLSSLVMTVFDSIVEVGSYAFDAIGQYALAAWDSIGLGGVDMFTTIHDGILDMLLFAEFAFKNMDQVAALVWVNMQLGLVRFWNETVHFFTEVIPAVLRWFGENFSDVMFTAFDLATTVFINLGKNIVAVFKNIPGIIAGTVSIAEIWTPLTEGFHNAIKELPDIPKREMGALEKSLSDEAANLSKTVGQSFEEFKADKMRPDVIPKELEEAASAEIPEVANNMAQETVELGNGLGKLLGKGMGKGVGDGLKDAAAFGSVEAASRLAEYMDSIRGPGGSSPSVTSATSSLQGSSMAGVSAQSKSSQARTERSNEDKVIVRLLTRIANAVEKEGILIQTAGLEG